MGLRAEPVIEPHSPDRFARHDDEASALLTRHTHGSAHENVAATLPSPESSITTLSPAVSQIVLTRLPVSTISPAERPLPSEAR